MCSVTSIGLPYHLGNGSWDWQDGQLVSKKSLEQSCLDELVVKTNQLVKTLYIYVGDEKGKPVYGDDVASFEKTVEEIGLSCRVVKVKDASFDPSAWDAKTSILYIPGAPASGLDEHLGAEVGEIQAYVKRGGKFLGWCGSAYWACQSVSYRERSGRVLDRVRSLSFWKGREEGPLFPCPENPSDGLDFSHRVVPIKWTGSAVVRRYFPKGLETPVLLSGGGSFVPAKEEHSYEVLACYSEQPPEKERACVQTWIGEGAAVLNNLYFTHDASSLSNLRQSYTNGFSGNAWREMELRLEEATWKIRLCFADVLYRLASCTDMPAPVPLPMGEGHSWTPWNSPFGPLPPGPLQNPLEGDHLGVYDGPVGRT